MLFPFTAMRMTLSPSGHFCLVRRKPKLEWCWMSISTEGKQKGWCFVYTGVLKAHSCGWFLMRSVNQLEKSPNNNLHGDSGGGGPSWIFRHRCQTWVTLHNKSCDPFSVGAYLLLLADPMSPGLCLQVILRVPVRVEDDHGVGRGQVYP